MLVAQPAEEEVSGAKAMLSDGLYTRFGKPDFAFALSDGVWRRGAWGPINLQTGLPP